MEPHAPRLERRAASVEARVLPANPRLVGHLASPLIEEEYRTLGATLHRAGERSGIRSLVVTSALPQEGKTLSAANIALVLSRYFGRRVLAIDADLRKPALHELFGIERGPGLCDALGSGAAAQPVQVQPRLWVMPAGKQQVEPARVLTSDDMRRLLAEASKEFDWVVIDTPPAGVLPDAQLLTAIADGVILVVRAGKTPYDICRRAAAAVSDNGKLLGVLLTRGATRRPASYYASYGKASRARE